MSLGKELLNKPIFTIDEGKQIGKVQDLYLDDALEVVLGLFVGSQGLVRRKSELIRSGDVVVFGVDAVLVRSDGVITDDAVLPAAKGWVRREKVIGREVDTPGGTRLGIIGDVVVDSTGRVTGFALSKTFVEGPLAEKRQIERSVIVDTGHQDGRMTVDLVKLDAALGGHVVLPEPAAELPIVVEEPPASDEPPAEE
jgi:uncharacterized protein YrrD